ncbi:type IV pilin [Haloplanus halophilus]|uniref:type IV pilin n=1 Tax=Haloplanus halophilus TaxID=2949993 RepID=UPI00203F73CB|nr:type IV pilin [Haloplanus sp. GDY1]
MAGRTAIGLLIALVVGVAVGGLSIGALPAASTTVAPTLSVDGDRVALTHRAGTAVDVRRLDVVVRVDGDPLAHQPPVPFFSAEGFHPGPTGPFNAAADPTWTPGERASFRVASTNRPSIAAGARVTVELRRGGRRLAVLSATA